MPSLLLQRPAAMRHGSMRDATRMFPTAFTSMLFMSCALLSAWYRVSGRMVSSWSTAVRLTNRSRRPGDRSSAVGVSASGVHSWFDSIPTVEAGLDKFADGVNGRVVPDVELEHVELRTMLTLEVLKLERGGGAATGRDDPLPGRQQELANELEAQTSTWRTSA